MRTLLTFLICAAIARAETAPQSKPIFGPVREVTKEEFQRQWAQSKHYDFELASPDGLVDSQGVHIAARDLPQYLAERHLDPRAYFLISITQSSPALSTVGPTVTALTKFGVKTIAFRHKLNGVAAPITGEYQPMATDHKVAMISIRPNSHSLVAGEPWPDLSRRPADLRPGRLPPKVRYAFASDGAMEHAAALLREHLVNASRGDGCLFAPTVALQYGAWRQFQKQPALSGHGKPVVQLLRLADGKPLRLQGRLITDPADFKTIEAQLRDQVRATGAIDLRALSSDEMWRWWPFVGFDFVEPILVLHTRNHAYAFVFEHDRVELVDDLNALPSLTSNERPSPAMATH